MTIISGIYVILHVKSGKIYLGQAQNVRKRWNEHRRDLISDKHHNIYLQRAWNKYGAKAFQFKILERCSVNQLDDREQHYLDVHIPKGQCYNISPNAGTTRGIKLSDETRKRKSESHKGLKASEETRHKMSETRKQYHARKRAERNKLD